MSSQLSHPFEEMTLMPAYLRPLLVLPIILTALSGCSKDSQQAPLPVDTSPVVHREFSQRPPKGCGSPFWGIHYGDALKTLREVEDYRPGTRDFYVTQLNDRRNEHLLAGISAKERATWLSSHGIAEKDHACIVPVYEAIGVAAKATLPNYQPRGYVHHDDDGLIADAVKQNLPGATILERGVSSPTWNIEKLGNGVPSSRYKFGMAWVKTSAFDDGFCRIMYINIVQDYSGGGTYGDSRAAYVRIEPAGCK
jgi:hypothetical protein